MLLLLRLFYEFFKVGLFSIGGGLATLPFLYEMAERTGWFTHTDVTNLIAISEYFGVTLDYLLKGPAPGWETTAGPPRRNIPSGLYSLRLPL